MGCTIGFTVLWPNSVAHWLARKIIALPCRAGSETDNEVHFCFEGNMIACFAFWREDVDRAGLRVYRNMHEDIEAYRNGVGRNAEFTQRYGQIPKATPV